MGHTASLKLRRYKNSSFRFSVLSEHHIFHTLSFEILIPYRVVTSLEYDVKGSAITFEYLKAEIVSISKPYLENLVYE